MLVVTNTRAAASAPAPFDSATVEPPTLKPNQQNHRMNTPSAPRVSEWPGIARALPSLVYLPIRGSQDGRAHKRRHAANHVYRRRTGEVMEAQLGEPATAPDPVTGDRIDDGR